jgi:Xaa-Pro aminopeptidase
MVNTRILQAKALLGSCELDAMVFGHLPNIRYLCGFTGSDGVLALVGDETAFLTDSRYTTQARQQVRADEIREYRVKWDGVLDFLAAKGAVRVGFEADSLTYATVEELKSKSAGRCEWVPVNRQVKSLRGIKDAEEIALMEQAAELNAECFAEVLPLLRPGVSEREIALALEFAFKRRGAEEKAFDVIVASGVRGALPHGVASDKFLATGELVTIDFGCRYRGYHSDETVTLAIGEVADRLREIHAVALEAHDRAVARVRPGVALREIDGAARDYIAERGFGDYFGHGTGHGLGLEVHEFPTVSSRSEEEAREGMVVTIEPGIYIPELGGVRIEDTVLITAGGCRRLTRIPKGLRTLPG